MKSSYSSPSGYATPRSTGGGGLTNLGKVLETLSNSLPTHASLQSALNPQSSSTSSLLSSKMTTPRRSGGLADYYERRIGSSQGSRRGFGGQHGAPSIPTASSSAGMSNIQYLNALMGKGVGPAAGINGSSTGRPALVIQTSAPPVTVTNRGQWDSLKSAAQPTQAPAPPSSYFNSTNTVSIASQQTQQSSNKAGALTVSVPPAGRSGIALSPIQTKKKSVRWSESLESYDTVAKAEAARSGAAWSKVGHSAGASGGAGAGEKTSVALKSVLVVHASSSTRAAGIPAAAPPPPDLQPQHQPQHQHHQHQRPSTTSALSRDSSGSGPSFMELASARLQGTNPGLSKPSPLPHLKAPPGGLATVVAGRRPSLSEQLASIGAKAEALTADIKAKAGMPADGAAGASDAPLFVVPSKCLAVGTLNCRYPSPARFFRDRIQYTFHHPFEATEIEMVMYYR